MAEIVTSRKLISEYGTDADTTRRQTLRNPLSSLDAEQVSNAMDVIVGTGALMDSKGNAVTVAKSAWIETVTQELLF